MGIVHIPGDVQDVSDSFHTFRELYEHRNLLFCLALADDVNAWKSKQHSDGTMYEGCFVAGTALEGLDITYHLPLDLWDLCLADELPLAPEWDGHEPQDVVARLRVWLRHYQEDVQRGEYGHQG